MCMPRMPRGAMVRTTHRRLVAPLWSSRSTAAATLVLCIVFYLAAVVGLVLHFPTSLVYFVWPPSVVLFVALLVSPHRAWWVFFLALLPVHLLAEWRTVAAPIGSLVLFYAVVWIQALVGVLCVEHLACRPFQLTSLRALIALMLGIAGAALAEALTLATVLVLTSPGANFWLNCLQTALADTLTMIVLAPALLIGWALARQSWLASGRPNSEDDWLTRAMRCVRSGVKSLTGPRVVEACLFSLGLLAVGLLAFGGYITMPSSLSALLYMILPLLLWAAVRFGLGGTSLALCGLTLLSILYAIHDRGPFITFSTTESLISLQLFFIAIAVPLLVLAVIIQERRHAQAELEQSEARFRTAFESAAVGMALVGLDGHPLEVNRTLVEMLGYAEEEVRTHAFRDFTHFEDEEPNLTLFRQAVAGEIASYEVEKRYRHKDGHLVWGHLSAGVVRDTAGKALYVVAHVQDISRRKQLEREQVRLLKDEQEAKHRLETVLEVLPTAVSIADAQGKVLQVNQAFRNAWAEHTLAGSIEEYRIYHGWHPNGQPMTIEDWALTRALTRGETVRGQEVDIQTFDGRYKTILNNAAPLRDDAGAIVGGVVAFLEITERKQLEQERTRAAVLEARGHEFQTLADHSPDLIARFDLSARFLYVNHSGANLLGLPPEQWVGKTWGELNDSPHVSAFWDQEWHKVIATHMPRAFETEVDAPNGRARTLQVRFIPEFAEDSTLRSVLGVATDISALKQAEARLAEQASRLEAIFDAMADGILVHDAQGTVLQVNPAYRELLGVEADPAYVTLPLHERVHRLQVTDEQGQPIPEEQSASTRALRGEVLTGARTRDVRMHTVDGRDIWVSTAAAPIRGRDGQITGVVLMLRDVTARRALERQIAEQASQLEAIIVAMRDGVAVYDQAGHLVRANPALGRLFGGAADDAYVTLPLRERAKHLHIDDDAGQLLSADQWPHWRVLRGEVLSGLTMTRTRIPRLDGGGEVWVETSAAPIYDVDGQITGAVLVTRDITKRRKLEEQIAEQASELEAVFEAMSDSVVVCDMEERVLQTNKALRRLLDEIDERGVLTRASTGRKQGPMSYGDVARIVGPNQQLQWHTIQAEIIAGRGVRRTVMHFRGSRPAWVEIRGEPIRRSDGQISGAVLVMRDVTARRRLELELAQRERQYRTLVENSPDIIARFDRDLRYLYVNPAIRSISSISPATYIGKTNAELGFPETAYGLVHSTIEQVFQLGEGQTLEGADETLLDSAAASYFRTRFLPEFAADGSVESVLAVATDITPLKRTEQALLAAQAAAEAARQKEEQRRQDAEWRRRVAESLRSVLGALNSKQPLSDILRLLVRHTGRLLGSEAAAIYGLEFLSDGQLPLPRARAMTIQAVRGLRFDGQRARLHQRLPFAHAAIKQMLKLEEPVAVWDVCGLPPTGETSSHANGNANMPWLQAALPPPYQTLLVIPIRVYDGFYGCLLLFYTQLCHFTNDEMLLAQAFADQVAQAITNSRLQAHIEHEASIAERNRLARELHDTVTQEIFSASLISESLPAIWRIDPAEAEVGLQELHTLTRSAQAGLRALLLELRPGELERAPLSDALEKLGAAISMRAGVSIATSLEGAEPSMPPPAKLAFYRVAQEALMNAAKYAQARAISVRLRSQAAGQIELEIADDGRGFDQSAIPSGHYGLAMMRERVQSVGARIHVTSKPGQGTRVVVAWQHPSADQRTRSRGRGESE